MIYIASDGKEFTNQRRCDEWEDYLITGIPITKPIRKISKPRVKKNKVILSNEEVIYNRYVYSANKSNRPFSLSLEEFSSSIINSDCIYCGINKAGGVDRLDNSKGYLLDNSVPCCTICNKMKHIHSKEFFIDHINRIIEYQRTK